MGGDPTAPPGFGTVYLSEVISATFEQELYLDRIAGHWFPSPLGGRPSVAPVLRHNFFLHDWRLTLVQPLVLLCLGLASVGAI